MVFISPFMEQRLIHIQTQKLSLANFRHRSETVELACRAHRTLYRIRAIGWDVAISDNGPVFIEGNDNWEISLNHAFDRSLRKDSEEVIS